MNHSSPPPNDQNLDRLESDMHIAGFNLDSSVNIVEAYVSGRLHDVLAPTVASELSETDKGLRDLVHEAMLMVHHTQQAAGFSWLEYPAASLGPVEHSPQQWPSSESVKYPQVGGLSQNK